MRHLCLALISGLAVSSCNSSADNGTGASTVTSVVVSGDSTVVIAGTRQLSATAMSGSSSIPTATFLWASGDTTKALVSSTGLVLGVRSGPVAISAVAVVDGVLSTVIGTHTMRVRIGSIVVTPNTPQLSSIGDSILLTAEARDAQNAPVGGISFDWRTRNPGVVEVTARTNTAQADVTALGNGTARIIVTGDGVSDSGTVIVRQVATSLSITPASGTLHSVGATLTPAISGNDARGNPVSASALQWTSNAAVATVNAVTGVITAVAEGQTKVIATSGSLADTVAVTVDQIPATIRISPANFGTPDVAMRTSQTAPFYAAVLDSLGQPAPHDSVTWSTDNAAVADVAATATLDSTVITTGIAGTANITATAGPATATRVVTVGAGLSYATDVQSVFDGNCTSCHTGASAPGGMSLAAGVSYTNIVDQVASEVASLKRVRPFRPDSSYLVHKIQGTQTTVGGSGARMPLGCSGASCLSNDVINTIRNWILQGALNN
ncbi:MAG TPA: Ig-like domain-containing protein [Gemmatimonadales bacterium]|nr:Ig-like domain-containing protein [Gemmatimonadales bacterium]